MKKTNLDPDNQPVSRKCMKKLAEVVGPLMVIMIVAQITTTFFIIRYLPGNTEKMSASLLTESEQTDEYLKTGQQISDIIRDNTRISTETDETDEDILKEATSTVVTKYIPVYTEPQPEPQPEQQDEEIIEEPLEEPNIHETDNAPTESENDSETNTVNSTGLIRTKDDSCPTGYALINARLEKTCE